MNIPLPRSITLIFRQSFNLSPLLTILVKHASHGRMKHNANNSTACHKKQKGMKVTQLTKNSLRYNHVK